MKIVFAGSGDFAAVILERLLQQGRTIEAVLTSPDRPAGRGQELTPTPVKKLAREKALALYEPPNVNDPAFLQKLNALTPDLLVVTDYGQRFGRDLLSLPRYYPVNVHPSLLPRFRGPAPIHRALLSGSGWTGVTVIRMIERMDAGPILGAVRVDIQPGVTAGGLERELARIGAELLGSVLDRVERGTILEIPQDERQATYAPKITRDDGRIQWNRPAGEISNFIRAMDPYPSAFTFLGEERTKVVQARPVRLKEPPKFPPGTIVAADRKAIWVSCLDGVVGIEQLQPAGKTAMSAGDFLNGHPVRAGDMLR